MKVKTDKNGRVVFPYATLDAAVKDAFKRLGGPEKAFALLVKGYKTSAWRKRAEENAKEADEAAKEAVRQP
jgi:hypothetical protein